MRSVPGMYVNCVVLNGILRFEPVRCSPNNRAAVGRKTDAVKRARTEAAQGQQSTLGADFNNLPGDRRKAPQHAIRSDRQTADLVRRLLDPEHAFRLQIGIELQNAPGAGVIVNPARP